MHCLKHLTSSISRLDSIVRWPFSMFPGFVYFALIGVWNSLFSQAVFAGDLVTVKETTPAIFLVEETNYLDRVVHDKASVAIFLVSGKKLHGEVRWHNAEELLIVTQSSEILVHKAVVSTILLEKPRYYLGYAAY